MHPFRKYHFDVKHHNFEKSWKKALSIDEDLPYGSNVCECAYCDYGIVDLSHLMKTFTPKAKDGSDTPQAPISYLPSPKGNSLGVYLGTAVCRNCNRVSHIINMTKAYIPRFEDNKLFGSFIFFTTFLQGEHMKETILSKYESAHEKKFKIKLRNETNDLFLSLDRLKDQAPESRPTLMVEVNGKIHEYIDPSKIKIQ